MLGNSKLALVGVLALALLAVPTAAAENKMFVTEALEANCPVGTFCWKPATFTARVGDNVTLEWVQANGSIQPHNLHIKAPVNEKTPITTTPENASITFTPTKTGEIQFICDVHPTMVGKIVVQSANGTGDETPTAPTRTPGFEVALLAAGALAVAVVLRRRG
ncbi:MAG TPA: cupredoxin domain-containing protein [Candidatus Thermoplasmatota archaeon]|nr:cupredoxin domain-containing protein [Candidatus Thermoplasmatota archaeon]